MARVKFGQGVADMRGSIGGTVFSRNANGAYTRNRTTPYNPNSVSQQVVRSSFGDVSRDWRSLSETEQSSWTDQAPNYPYTNSLGEASVYTPFQLFQKVNSQLVLIGLSKLGTMVAPLPIIGMSSSSIDTLTAADFDITLFFQTGLSLVPTSHRLVVSATAQLSAGINKPKRPDFKQIYTAVSGTDMAAKDLNAAYNAVFPTPRVVGYKIFISAMLVRVENGIASNSIEASAVIA